MATLTTSTSEQTTLYPTKVKCRECGGPVYAVDEREQRMIAAWPRDGFWLCPDCRPKWEKGRR